MALVRQGLALQALGRTRECLERWKAAQQLSPQDRELEKHIESLQPRRQAFYQPWQVDPASQPVEFSTHPAAGDEGSGTIRLLDQTVVRLLPNGMTSSFRQQLIGILNTRGADHARTFRIEYAPARQQVRILNSRVIRPDGHLDSSVLVDDFSLSEPWYNLYYDVHAREVTFPALAPGDLVELSNDVGTVRAMAYPSDAVKRGHTFLLFGQPRGAAGDLVSDHVDPATTIPSYKQVWADVRRIGPQPDVTRRVSFRPRNVAS